MAAARRIAPDLIIGASSHSLEEALAAQEAGPAMSISAPSSHRHQTRRISPGPEAIARIAPRLRIPGAPWAAPSGKHRPGVRPGRPAPRGDECGHAAAEVGAAGRAKGGDW